MVVAGGSLGFVGVIIVIVYLLMGGNPQNLQLSSGGAPGGGGLATGSGGSVAIDPAQEEVAQRVRKVLGDTEDVWTELFRERGQTYQPAVLVLFTDATETACGWGQSATGPFYCPADGRVYIDLSFYDELSRRFGAPGDFAQAYVVAHEVGHHVQNLLGISGKVDAMRSRVSQEEANDLSVRLELQADFLAGVWAHHADKKRKIIEPGDIEEAINAASQIGDDRLQKRSQGYAVPDTFTHGSSVQRVKWFMRGFESGDMTAGDTFSVGQP
jgi:predicted metalloprotease